MLQSLRPIALASALCLAASAPAFAHAHLKASTPASGASVARPGEIDLAFTEGVNPKFTGLSLSGPGGAPVSTGPARPGAGGDATLVVPVAGPLAPGTYKVDWHALATDGHKTEGSFSFTVAP
ncbi:copper homeostasis periplasmic binding protein CopC [Lichenibacterium dinghuense]|uniref:copper homeostasis periplasmic binding protein CopC n=1 Tax=Lichenibacterium dinghuense TaxID=2895977 RepID=UPI001F006046|nr:copper homeostasis periplasmic binding protein CopC [Lichenibacterium sp. 6Y81]